jgi:ketosteroid isomerase-like protein
MTITRRHVAFAGALALGAADVLRIRPSLAQSNEAEAVGAAVEALRQAMLAADKANLDALTADQLSYGHSGGVIQNKTEFIDVIVGEKTIYKAITLVEPSVAVAGDAAIARHVFTAETEADGKPASSKVGVLQVWQKQNGNWKLLARQAFRT